ncbi:hypothetical protein V1520DRAFT_226936 [Lipomyces starkeyi]|uniref:SWIM-type domain-containing protein n=1 Tax=Lipomyces starkeyi NRRL Y-11557 TaxID=675824 RepID=A0A1E3Q583_LIPST|nr:hypothetical protein LIPSTDRAFT_277849 [Lipomyces starkeyi NRRL Y-11557]
MNYTNRQHSEQLSVINLNENIIVRYNIRTQVETSMLCSAISRSALELIHTEVIKKIHGQEEPGTMKKCNCATRIRYLLPCSHQIQLDVPLPVAQVHPRWRLQGGLPAITVPSQNLDSSAIADIRDTAVLVKRKGRPRGTPRFATSAEIVQQAADRTERVRLCGSCRKVVHTRRTCPIPVHQSTGHTREGQSGFSASLPRANDASIQVEQLPDADIATGKEDDPPETNDEDGSSLEEMWTDIMSTIEEVNGNDVSEHAK